MIEPTRILRKTGWRLVPFLMLLYFVNFLDRVNIGFAALSMNRAIGLSPTVYGWGAALRFLLGVAEAGFFPGIILYLGFWFPAAAGAIALVNSIGNLGGFAGPYLIDWIRDATGSFAPGLTLAGACLAAGLLALAAPAAPAAPPVEPR
jgi:MFS family permease